MEGDDGGEGIVNGCGDGGDVVEGGGVVGLGGGVGGCSGVGAFVEDAEIEEGNVGVESVVEDRSRLCGIRVTW